MIESILMSAPDRSSMDAPRPALKAGYMTHGHANAGRVIEGKQRSPISFAVLSSAMVFSAGATEGTLQIAKHRSCLSNIALAFYDLTGEEQRLYVRFWRGAPSGRTRFSDEGNSFEASRQQSIPQLNLPILPLP